MQIKKAEVHLKRAGFRNWQNYHLKMKIFPEIAQP